VREYQLLWLGLSESGRTAGGKNAGHAGAGSQKRAAVERDAARLSGWHWGFLQGSFCCISRAGPGETRSIRL
jgi:hypothetical protein